VQYHVLKNKHNLMLDSIDTAVNELGLFKIAGGGTIVEMTTHGIGRNPKSLEEIAKKSNVNIIAGAGYYVDKVHPEDMSKKTIDVIETQIIREVQEGIYDTNIKAGVIGEIGTSWPITENEIKVVRAAARASLKTGAAINIHPGRCDTAPLAVLEILKQEGVNMSRVVMSHIDRTIFDIEKAKEIAKTGCVLEYDLFGMETSYYPFSHSEKHAYMPSDHQRIEYLYQLIQSGYKDQIVVGHDIYSKHRLATYGGHGYGHIFHNLIPRMLKRGITESDIHTITVDTPSKLLTFI